MKTIFNQIKIHYLFYIVILITILTGYFKDTLIITAIIITHELGHILISRIYKWKIDKIVILPFGGVTIFKEDLNRPLKEELFIMLGGPLIQMLVFSQFKSDLVQQYHYSILLFNLLPIYPLDGAKMLNIILSKFIPFIKSLILVLMTSIIVIIIFLINNFNLVSILMMLFLILEVIKNFKNINYISIKFLYERYINKYKFKKYKKIKKLNNMYRDYNHQILYKNKYIDEDKILMKMFDFNKHL